MLTHNGALIMKLDNPEIVQANVNLAKTALKGQDVYVCKHSWDNTWKLRGMGFNAPFPRLTDADFTGRFTPMKHQRAAAQFKIDNPRCFDLSEMGTGKTASSLWAAEFLLRNGVVDRVLVVATLSILHVWQNELFNVNPGRTCAVLFGTKKKRLELLAQETDYCIINHDGVGTIADELEKAKFPLIIVDEASALRNSQTQRFKKFKKLAQKAPYVWFITGSPTPNAPTDAYGLIKLVNPASFTGGIGLFKEMTMFKVSQFIWKPKYNSAEIVGRYLKPAIRFTKAECLDLPPLTYVNRECQLSTEQLYAFENMRKAMVVDAEDAQIVAANSAVKIGKLLQIVMGVVKGNDGQVYYVEDKHRLELLKEVIEETGGKAIIVTPFVGVLKRVKDFLDSYGFNSAMVYGDTSKAERVKIFEGFQSNAIDLLLAQPRTISHGLTFTASSYVIWYGTTLSAEQYTQTNDRIHRAGQDKACTIVHLGSTQLEWGLYEGLANKLRMQDTILRLYENVIGGKK